LRNKSDRIDVFSVDLIWIPRFSKWGEPLTGYIREAEQDAILECALEPCSVDSVLVAVPMYIDIGLMYYRRDILKTLPDYEELERKLQESISWDEFIALRDRLGRDHEPYYLFQGDDFEGLVCNYFELLAGLDNHFFAEGRIDLTSPHAVKAAEMMVDLVYRHRISPPLVSEFDEIRSYIHMLREDGVFVRGWPNFLEGYRAFYRDSVDVTRIGRAALPHFPGKKPVSVFGGWALMVSRDSQHKEAAVTFIRYVQRVESQRLLFNIGGYIPVSKAVYADSVFMVERPNLSYYRQLLDNGFHRPAMEEYTKMSDILSHFLHRALKRELSAREALTKAAAAIAADEVLIK
jgi:multiple sugar transport system substrate-binding protein